MRKKLVAINDLYKIKFLREITLAPSGDRIAYTVEWLDYKKNTYYSNLYVVDLKAGVRHYIRGNKKIRSLRWSPDGKFISFIMSEKESQHIWLIPVDGGEPFSLTSVPGSFGKYVWTPNSRYIICEFTKHKEDKERIPEKGKPPLYYYIKRPWYKLDGRGILPEEKPHIWRVHTKTGVMKQLTSGKNGDTSPNISPDGKKIVFVSNRRESFEEKLLYTDIFVVDIEGKKEMKIKTLPGPKAAPFFLPDNETIVYVGRKYPNDYAGWRNDYIWAVGMKKGKVVNLTASLDRTVSDRVIDDLGHPEGDEPKPSRDGKKIFFAATDYGNTILYGVSVKKRKVFKYYDEPGRVYAFDYDGKETFVIARSTPTDPGNIYLLKNGRSQKLTDINRDYHQSHRIASPEEIRFTGFKGREIQGWILKPPDFNKNRRYPLLVQIHGGPHFSYGNSFFHEFQVLAANGYIVFYCNPHGSIGYGEGFAEELHNRWGIPDSQDILKGIAILKRRRYIDQKRLGVMGGSYGGFMTNWLIGHTDIFRAAVTMRSVVNMLSFFSSDFGFSLAREFKGLWWHPKNFKFYWNMSPIKYVAKIRTPLLIVHSEQDHRCPISQGEELFVALKLLKREVEMLRFPSESHGLSRHGSPRRREKRLEFILKFVDRYLKK